MEKNGVKYVLNGRTKQKMPHYFQLYENYMANQKRLSIKSAVSNLNKPYLITHGKTDTSVSCNEAIKLNSWNSDSELFLLDECNHVFNTSHPWSKMSMSIALNTVVIATSNFIIRHKKT